MNALVQLAEAPMTARCKRSSAFAEMLWRKWPRADDWPGVLDLYEAAAFLRVDYKSIWRACKVAKSDGKARLRHQRIGNSYRLDKADVAGFGRVEARAA